MNIKSLSVLLVSFLLGACSGTPSTKNDDLANCPTQGWWFCQGSPQAPTVQILTGGDKIKVKPYCVKVAERSEIVFRIVPRDSQALGTVRIIPKDDSSSHDDWLAGENSENKNYIYVEVPEEVDLRKKHYYGVKIGDRCVDPRVHFEN